MKRLSSSALIIGLIVAGILCALQAYGILFRAEFGDHRFSVMRHSNITTLIANHWQYFFITIFAFGVAWMTVEGAPRGWAWWLVPVLLLEFVGITWVCALYHVFFQPLPSILAIAGSFLLASAYYLVARGSRARVGRSHVFRACLAAASSNRLSNADFPLESRATSHEATVVVSDIANKHELAEDSPPGGLGSDARRVSCASPPMCFAKMAPTSSQPTAKACVAIFGFPVMTSTTPRSRPARRWSYRRLLANCANPTRTFSASATCISGLSSGTIIAARLQNNHHTRNCADGRAGGIGATFLHRESLLRFAHFAWAAHL